MDRAHTVSVLLEDLVAAIEERDTGDPDGGDWLVSRRIRRLERELAMAYRYTPELRRRMDDQEGARGEDRLALAGIV